MKNRNLEHKDHWATPKDFYDKLDTEFHFDFDPCPLHGEHGLDGNWGKRNFINPPYSRKLKEAFVKKSVEQSRKGKLCVLLLPISTSTALFHDWIQPNAKEIRFIRGRISFEGINTFGKTVGKSLFAESQFVTSPSVSFEKSGLSFVSCTVIAFFQAVLLTCIVYLK